MSPLASRVTVVFGLVVALGFLIVSLITLESVIETGGVLVTTPFGEGPYEIMLGMFASLILTYLICSLVVRGDRK